MASQTQNTKQRIKDDPNTDSISNNDDDSKARKQKRMVMAKRGLRSLVIAVALPLSLALASMSLGSSATYRTLAKPFWFPNVWALHLTCLGTSFLMGLSGWFVWADGGFHRKPLALALYTTQLALSLTWEPIVFGMGAIRLGLLVCLAMLGTLVGCSYVSAEVNPIAGDMVKPCLAWAGFLVVVNLKLL